MRIILENGSYHLLNYGDVAMLQIAVKRLRELWPRAYIETFTNAPGRLARYLPDVSPLNPVGRDDFLKAGKLFGRLHRFIPESKTTKLTKLEEKIWRVLPDLGEYILKLKIARHGITLNTSEIRLFLKSLFRADLLVASGGGYLNDPFKWSAKTFLDTFQIANELGIPTAMFGQGLGPINDSALRAKAKAILPSIKLIAIREKRAAVPLLFSLDVRHARVIDTGDDAIELSYEQRKEELGIGIGVNMRVAKYSQIGDIFLKVVQRCLHAATLKYNAKLIPLPTSMAKEESDVRTLQKILYGNTYIFNTQQLLKDQSEVIREVGLCRIVVTSSYHPAVFALAQGIPVVGLAQSQYYIDKFMGLADHFGDGCEVIFSNGESLSEKLNIAIDRVWTLAPKLRPQLLEAAKQQILAGRAAYQRAYEIFESEKRKNKT